MNLKSASALALLAVLCFGIVADPQSPPLPPTSGRPESGKPVVVIDPGHGGTDPGARGPTGLIEKDLTLQYAQAMQRQLEQSGVMAVLTRGGDQNPSFDDRTGLANGRRADLFLSLHFGTVGAARMVRIFVYRIPEGQKAAPRGEFLAWDSAQAAYLDRSRAFAQLFEAQLQQEAPGSSAGLGEASLRVLRGAACPAIALEVGSVSVRDAAALAGFEERLARALAGAVARFVPDRSAAIHRAPGPRSLGRETRSAGVPAGTEVHRDPASRPQASGLGTGYEGLKAVSPAGQESP